MVDLWRKKGGSPHAPGRRRRKGPDLLKDRCPDPDVGGRGPGAGSPSSGTGAPRTLDGKLRASETAQRGGRPFQEARGDSTAPAWWVPDVAGRHLDHPTARTKALQAPVPHIEVRIWTSESRCVLRVGVWSRSRRSRQGAGEGTTTSPGSPGRRSRTRRRHFSVVPKGSKHRSFAPLGTSNKPLYSSEGWRCTASRWCRVSREPRLACAPHEWDHGDWLWPLIPSVRPDSRSTERTPGKRRGVPANVLAPDTRAIQAGHA